MWEYTKLANVVGTEEKSQTFKVENETELQEVLTKISIDKDQLTFVEVVMSQGDRPELLVKLGKRFGQQNA